MKTFAITARAAIAAMLLGGAVAAGDAAGAIGRAFGGEYASSSRVAYNQSPGSPRRAPAESRRGLSRTPDHGQGPDATPAGGAVAGAAADPRRSTAGPRAGRQLPCARRKPAPRRTQPQAPRQVARTTPGYRAHQDVAPRPRDPGPAGGAAIPRVRVRQRMVPSAVRSSPIAGPYSPGTIVVDTKSRHLFFIESNGKATPLRCRRRARKAFPGAVPRRSPARRNGRIGARRNPCVAASPNCLASCRGGPENPLGGAGALSRQHPLSHPRHQRAAYDRPGHVIRLHPDE